MNHTAFQQSNRRAFTILELMVVLTVIAILMALLLPAVQKVRGAARRVECINRMKQVGLAIHSFQTAHGHFPAWGKNRLSWRVTLLPYLELDALHDQFDHEQGIFNHEHHMPLLEQNVIPHFRCPSNGHSVWASADFMMNGGNGLPRGENGFCNMEPSKPSDMADGLSNTMALCEVVSGKQQLSRVTHDNSTENAWIGFANHCQMSTEVDEAGKFLASPWHGPGPPSSVYHHAVTPGGLSCASRTGIWNQMIVTADSLHDGGVNSLLADGSVRLTAREIDAEVWRSLGSASDSRMPF